MGDGVRNGIWLARGLFVLAVTVMLFLRLLPLRAEAGSLPGPDLLMCLCCAWVLRRPDHLPALLIAGVVLVEDMLLMRPPGLWSALMLLGTEFLRSRAAFSRELTLVSEWVMVAVVMLAMMLGFRLVMAVTMLPQPGLGLTLIQFVFSVLAYPFVVGALRLAFGLRKPATGEVDALGRPL
jgi:rod shape-determining protein MreD